MHRVNFNNLAMPSFPIITIFNSFCQFEGSYTIVKINDSVMKHLKVKAMLSILIALLIVRVYIPSADLSPTIMSMYIIMAFPKHSKYIPVHF